MRIVEKFGFLLIILLFCSCASNKSIRGAPLSSKESETIEIIGFVETKFEVLNSTDEQALLRKGYDELMKVAQKKYSGKIGIRNIELKRKTAGKNFLPVIVGHISTDFYINVEAKGAVVKTKE